MAKANDLLSRFGGNLAESMGAGRSSSPAVQGGAASGYNAPASPSRHDGVTRLKAGAEIAIGRIAADPNQPRTEFDPGAIEQLAESLKEHGQLQPISVRWSEAMGRYLIVAGERRWRASQLAGCESMACVILDGEHTDSQVLEMQLIENALREDLQPIEQARAFRALMEMNGWSTIRLAKALSLNDSTIVRALALLELPCTVQDQVASGALAPSVAYEVSKLDDPAAQAEVAARVVSEGLSRAETIEAVKRASPSKKAGSSKGRGASKPSKLVVKAFRVAEGKVTIELRKGLDSSGIEAALLGALEAVRGQKQEAA
ncbi:ParB/RepB/Spo0J family partition protein (plasmid) [Isosphaeraceae bacterium EP7]